MKWIPRLAVILIFGAVCFTVMCVQTIKPSSWRAFLFFCAWLTLPYMIMSAVLIRLRFKAVPSVYWHAVAALVSAGGIFFLTDVIFWHPDPQGALAVMMTPILQGIATAVLFPIAYWMSQKNSK